MQRIKKRGVEAIAVTILCLLTFSLLLDSASMVLSLDLDPTISTSGSVTYPPPPPTKYTRPDRYLAYTGYEGSTTPTGNGVWEDGYLKNFWNNQGNNNSIVTSYYDGGKKVLPFSGSEMLQKEYNGYNLRNEWQVLPDYTIEHYYQSYWVYIPTTFGTDWSWWVPGWPSLREYSVDGTLLLHLEKPLSGAWNTIEWRFMYGTTPVNNNIRYWDWHIPSVRGNAWEDKNAYQYPTASNVQWKNVPIPQGRWFRVEAYVYRHPSNGIVKVWLTDTDANNNPLSRQLVFSIQNVRTRRDTFTSPLHSYAQKLYGFSGSSVPKTVLYDDVYICDAYPYNDWAPPTE